MAVFSRLVVWVHVFGDRLKCLLRKLIRGSCRALRSLTSVRDDSEFVRDDREFVRDDSESS